MKPKTQDLTGAALDWAVTTIEDPDALRYGVEDWREQRRSGRGEYPHRYHQNWNQGGPIIEREGISLEWSGWGGDEQWLAYIKHDDEFKGPTPLIAAMRCYVASKLGDTIDIPEELL